MSLETTKTAVALEILFRILPTHRLEFLQAVDSLIASAATTPGLGALSCFEDLGVQNTFLWRECWGSLGELQHRLESTGIKTLLGAIGVLGELEDLQILEPNDPTSETWA
jgi:quinol monooxygenase YgiN